MARRINIRTLIREARRELDIPLSLAALSSARISRHRPQMIRYKMAIVSYVSEMYDIHPLDIIGELGISRQSFYYYVARGYSSYVPQSFKKGGGDGN